MTPPADTARDQNHRLPGEISSHGVGLSSRFRLSYRDVQALLCERGRDGTYEAMRPWCRTFAPEYADQRRRRRPRPGAPGHRDEVLLTINGQRHDRWRAVEQEDNVRDILVQRRRNKQAAKKFFPT